MFNLYRHRSWAIKVLIYQVWLPAVQDKMAACVTAQTGACFTDTLDTLMLRQNGCHFVDDIFKCTFSNENVWIFNKNLLKFVPEGLTDKIPALVRIIAWCRRGNKPLSKPVVRIMAWCRRGNKPLSEPVVRIMTWCWRGNKPLSEPMMVKLQMHICVTQTQWVKKVPVNDKKYEICWYEMLNN